MEPTIFKFILRYSKRQQLYVLLITALMWPLLYVTLELPKMIVNDAIDGRDFPKTVLGMEFGQIGYLMVLCFAFLTLVLAAGGLKYYINVYRGRLGERMLRRLRYELYARVLRFPLPHFKRVSSGEIIPMITAEVEPVGGFVGEAFALPAFQGGMLLVYLGFIFVQDSLLGAAAIALYPLQMWLIPKLQAKVNALAKRRVRTVRKLADRVGETVSGIEEIHAHDTSRLARADIAHRLNTIYDIRYELFRRKFAIKFLNNFLAQLTPFFFYSAGGYFVIRGDLTFGALVAVLAAYKDLASPWKELLRWYQVKEDIRIKYEQVIEQFAPEDMLDAELQEKEPEDIPRLTGALVGSNLTLSEDGRVTLVDGANFTVPLDKHVAVVGDGASGKEEMVQLIARLLQPTTGSLRIGDLNLAAAPEAITGRRMSYVGANAYIFSARFRDNLFYGLKHKPIIEPSLDEAARLARARAIADARDAGNTTDNYLADWTDYAAAGAEDAESLQHVALTVLTIVDMKDDIYEMGLRGTIDPVARPRVAERILEARWLMRERLADPEISALIEGFDQERFNVNATLAENLLFGRPVAATFNEDRLAENPYVLEVLRESELYDGVLEIGYKLAETMVELFSGLPPGHAFFEQYSFIDSEDLPEFQLLLGRGSRGALAELSAEDRARLISLSFRLAPARHRLGLIDEDMQERVVRARHRFAENLPDNLRGAIEFFNADAYTSTATLRENILFGKLVYGQARSAARVGELVAQVLDKLHMREIVMAVGLDFPVGIAGSRLSATQRQKLAIARGVLKRPDVLILNEATRALDSAVQARVMENLLATFEGRGVIWGLHRASLAARFDHVLVIRDGKVVEQGEFETLAKDGTALSALLQSE